MDPTTTLSPPTGDGALARLRHATAPQHERIEDLLALRSPYGRDHHGRVLQGFAAFLAGWEPRVERALPWRLKGWFARGRGLALLERDLQALSLPMPQRRATVPTIEGLAQALGSMYVLEGAALGGQVIAADLRRRLGIGPDNGAAFYNGSGRGTAARWREFRELASAELDADGAGVRDAEDAAVRTFDALLATFEDCLRERAVA